MQCNFSNRIQSKRESHKNLPLYSCNFDVNLKNEYTLEKNDQWILTLIFSSKVFNNVHVLIKLWLLIFYVRLYFYTVMKFVCHNLSQFLIYRRCWKISVWRSLEEVLWLWWDSQGEVIQSVSWRVIILVKLLETDLTVTFPCRQIYRCSSAGKILWHWWWKDYNWWS